MIRSVLTILFLFAITSMHAQSLDSIRQDIARNNWQKAKQGIESFLLIDSNKHKAEPWQLKSLVLFRFLSDKNSQPTQVGLHREAFHAYTRYIDLSDSQRLSLPPEHELPYGITFSNIERGNTEFHNKRFEEALQAFQEVESMEQFIIDRRLKYKDLSFPSFDTQLYVNIAAAAVEAGRVETALKYYRKIADNRIHSKGFDGIYRYLAAHYDSIGDKHSRDRYLSAGRELYPSDPYWCQLELKDAGADKKDLLARYEHLTVGHCNNYLTHYNYAVELYNYCYRQEARPADFQKMHPRIALILKKALKLESSPDANLLMCRYQLLLANDLIDEYNKIKDAKKQQQIMAQVNKRYDDVLSYATNAYNYLSKKTDLDAAGKESYGTACKMLGDYWERKGDKVKAKQFLAKANL